MASVLEPTLPNPTMPTLTSCIPYHVGTVRPASWPVACLRGLARRIAPLTAPQILQWSEPCAGRRLREYMNRAKCFGAFQHLMFRGSTDRNDCHARKALV